MPDRTNLYKKLLNLFCYSYLVSLLASLVVIVYTSFWMITSVAGLKTHEETLYNLSQGKDIEECYLLVKTSCNHIDTVQVDLFKWSIKTDEEKKKIIEYSKALLEYGNPLIKCDMADFLGSIKETSAVRQLIKNLDDNKSCCQNTFSKRSRCY